MDTTLLPAAIKGDKIALSTAARAKIAGLNGSCPQAFTFQLAWTWTVIIGAIVWAEYVNAPWATVIAIFLVATRQNLLGLLVHEQAHLLGYRGRFGDLVVNCFAAYPLLVLTVEGYAQVHLAHHRDYFNATDPDFQRKSGDEWSIPMRPIDLAKLFLMDLLGINTLKLIRGKQPIAENMAFARRHRVPRWLRPAYFVSVAALLTLSGTWMLFLVYWLLPIVTITQVMVRWGALCEHKYNLLGASVVDSTPLIILSWWERLLLPNLNFAMHPYHHFFPGVSFSRLPTLHAIFEQEGLVEPRQVFHGYLAYLRYITRPPSTHGTSAPVHHKDPGPPQRRENASQCRYRPRARE